MSSALVRYRVKPGAVESNAELVRAVYAELDVLAPPGFGYATFVLEDGHTFIHVAVTEEGADAPLPGLEAFRRFRSGLEERCDEPPQVTPLARQIGGYGMAPPRQNT